MSGREQLQAWIDRRFQGVRGTQSEAAKFLGLDQSYLSQLLAGKRPRPGLDVALRIERKTGIPVEAWVDNDEGDTPQRVPVTAGNRRDGKR